MGLGRWEVRLEVMAYGDVVVYWAGWLKGMSGTSFASPQAAALLADYLSAQPNPERVDEFALLSASSEDMLEPGWDERTGSGRVDAAAMAATDASYRVPLYDRVLPYLAGASVAMIVGGVFIARRYE